VCIDPCDSPLSIYEGIGQGVNHFINKRKGLERMNEGLKSNKIEKTDHRQFETEMRLAEAGDLDRLKEIWKLCFGDEDQYIENYFNHRNWKAETAVLVKGGRIVSMLAMIPADLVKPDGSRLRSAMIYAVATHPDEQKKGLADDLMRFSNQYLASQGILETFLVPAGAELFRFYEKRGYGEAFYHRQREISGTQASALEVPDRLSLTLSPAEPEAYNAARRRFLSGSAYIDYREEEIRHQKRVANQSGGDIYLILRVDSGEETDIVIGCAIIEQSPDFTVVKELLAEEQFLASAVKHISGRIHAEKYLVRTPAFSGKSLGGTVSAFGMLHLKQKDVKTSLGEAYLGIAFD
jgi:GNAT superfamily N-acetyltransferase